MKKRTKFEIIRDILHDYGGRLSVHDMREIHRITTELLESAEGTREPYNIDWSWRK